MKRREEVAVSLRKFTRDDIARKIAWAHDPRINRFLHHELPLTEEKVGRWLDRMHDEDRHDLVIETHGGEPIGTIGLENLDRQHRRGEYYICIGRPEYFGTTASFNAGSALLAYAFLQLGLHKVFAVTENMAAVGHLRKLGLEIEGILRGQYLRDGRSRNGIQMSVLAREYLASRALGEVSSPGPVEMRPLYERVIGLYLHSRPAVASMEADSVASGVLPTVAGSSAQSRHDGVLEVVDRAAREGRGGRCGEVPLAPRDDDRWSDVLGSMIAFSVSPRDVDQAVRSAREMALAAQACHQRAPLTPALWHAVHNALTASLATLDLAPASDAVPC